MPHKPHPFYKSRRRAWYVELRRVQHVLGKHPDGLPEPKKGKNGWDPPPEIWKAFHAVMATLADEPTQSSSPVASGTTYPFVAVVIDEFMGWLRGRVRDGSKAPRTLVWYEDYLSSFLRFLCSIESPPPVVPLLTVDRLAPAHVYQWVDSQPGWATGKRGAMVAVSRALNWAAKAGLLKSLGGRSPLAGLEKPAQGRRDKLVSPDEYAEVLSLVKDQEFRDLVELAWETGARPHELFTVEAGFVEQENGCWTFPVQLSKGKKIQRVVYLSDRALEISRRLVTARPSGTLLRTTTGTNWCVSSVKCRFQKLRLSLGRKRLQKDGQMPPKIKRLTALQRNDAELQKQHEAEVLQRREAVNRLAWQLGPRFNLYAFRHSRITEALVNGLDAVTVSVLAGHKDTTMISRHYAHLAQKHGHMREAARKATGS